jgi:hypothetical protein
MGRVRRELMSNKHQDLVERLVKAVLEGEGVTDPALRTSIERAAASGASGGDGFAAVGGALPAVLWPYLQKVNRHAYKVTDGDVDALKEQAYSEDAIFELTVSAALGAGLGRLEQGLGLLEGTEARHEAG